MPLQKMGCLYTLNQMQGPICLKFVHLITVPSDLPSANIPLQFHLVIFYDLEEATIIFCYLWLQEK